MRDDRARQLVGASESARVLRRSAMIRSGLRLVSVRPPPRSLFGLRSVSAYALWSAPVGPDLCRSSAPFRAASRHVCHRVASVNREQMCVVCRTVVPLSATRASGLCLPPGRRRRRRCRCCCCRQSLSRAPDAGRVCHGRDAGAAGGPRCTPHSTGPGDGGTNTGDSWLYGSWPNSRRLQPAQLTAAGSRRQQPGVSTDAADRYTMNQLISREIIGWGREYTNSHLCGLVKAWVLLFVGTMKPCKPHV